jgi:hypothetical protein
MINFLNFIKNTNIELFSNYDKIFNILNNIHMLLNSESQRDKYYILKLKENNMLLDKLYKSLPKINSLPEIKPKINNERQQIIDKIMGIMHKIS